MEKKRILVVDDRAEIRTLFSEALSLLEVGQEIEVDTACDGHQALEMIKNKRGQYDIVFADIRMPKMDGIELLKNIKNLSYQTKVIMITGYSSVDNAIATMKYGAFDYMSKPVKLSDIELIIKKIVNGEQKTRDGFGEKIITSDRNMIQILETTKMVSKDDAPILIQGESGTGKEVLAKAIHKHSKRSETGQFVAVNCAELPETLLESELFGYEKGAFTGATSRKKGKFELANKGTLLLDEIGEMSLSLQPKLLRALQEQTINRVGSEKPTKVDVRIISTTNAELQKMVEEGKFREDLYYRLDVVPIELPPLRKRSGDIPILARHFLREFSDNMNEEITDISDDAMEILCNYHWPGNIRQLRNIIQRATILCSAHVLMPSHFLTINSENMTDSEFKSKYEYDRHKEDEQITIQVGTSIEEAEKKLILKTLEKTDGNKKKAAEILGVTDRTIRNKLKKYNN